ncbi:hypothetical protein IAR55_004185 [Kwoniella newhampshirensis]|uniref:Inositol phospholipid synthesis and fat-storage-inducing TM-domain-containing protein n=1 Tax=Kwoniella newhampshirensis TaxID=1651941 RepID=A0AAW0YQ91_9TREE
MSSSQVPSLEPPTTPTSLPRITTSTPQRHTRRPSGSYASPIDIKPKSPAARRMSMTTTSQTASLSPESVGETVMGNLQLVLAGVVTSLMLTGIMYSLIFQTSLDTSQIHHHHLPHRAPYFARKSNIFNSLFVKRAWGWTSLLYLAHLFTSPRLTRVLATTTGGVGSRTRRLGVWLIATLFWALFARWFFGAGLGDRIIALTGGNCALALPKEVDVSLARKTFSTLFTSGQTTTSPQAGRLYLPLPEKFCTGTPLTPSSFPDLFALLPSSAILQTGNPVPTDDHESLIALPRPRWHKGFDISGHAFLLTLSIMVLARELEPTWRAWLHQGSTSKKAGKRGAGSDIGGEEETQRGWLAIVHPVVTLLGTGLLGIWLWMIVMTAVYFHNPPEKLSGLVVGLVASFIINTLIPTSTRTLLSPYNAATTSTTGNTTSSTPIRPLSYSSFSDENAARRGAIVDDGIIYETDEEDEVQDSPTKRRGVDRNGTRKAKLE